jgi:pimeloyl-ACP methyl ester carboxylesterase
MREHDFLGLGPHGFHRVHYYEWGDPENERVVICVHGLTRTGRDFDHLAEDLSEDFRVICPDIPGRGKSAWLSDKQDYSYPQYCTDMAALVARTGAPSVDWVGTSMGGIIGILLAAQPRAPIGRLVINDVGPFIPKTALERLKLYVGTAPTFGSLEEGETYLRFISAPFGPLTDAQWRHLAVHSLMEQDGKWSVRYDPAIAHAFQGEIEDVEFWAHWDSIQCPVLLIRGAESDLLSTETAEEMTRRGPETELVEFVGIGHAPMLMEQEQIGVIREFLMQS